MTRPRPMTAREVLGDERARALMDRLKARQEAAYRRLLRRRRVVIPPATTTTEEERDG